jgi:Subtilase family
MMSHPMFFRILKGRFLRSSALSGVFFLSTALASLGADPSVPANIDSHLQRWVEQANAGNSARATILPRALAAPAPSSGVSSIPGRFDASGRVLVHIHLDGTQSLETVEKALISQGISIQAKSSTYRHGIMAAFLDRQQVVAAARTGGVRSIVLEGKPHTHVGAVTSEGAVVLKTDVVNKAGIKGDGITVGVLSDSFNTAQLYAPSPPATTAADDVRTGDLPVVKVLEDFNNNGLGGTDEGRAMCQIVYDLAPHCNLAFATAFVSEIDFANNIVRLRADANCDVIVDDIGYSDDPVFSDGLLAQAVNTVATSTALPGHPAVYCSSAGNEGDNGYINTYRDLTDGFVRRAGNHGNLKLEQVAPNLTAGGWHNWNPYGGNEPVTAIVVPGDPTVFPPYSLFLQWDDPFDLADGITTNFNFLVFDQDGNYLPDLSGTSDAFKMQEAYQQTGDLAFGTTYQIAITRSRKRDPLAPPPPPAHQLSIQTFLDGAGNIQGKYFHAAPLNVQTTYGHAAANGAIDVAAYIFDWRGKGPYQPAIEPYTSPGPVVIYFDASGNRLATPELRLKPEVAAVDGVGTTFFGGPYQDQFAFFGTSAAAPHVAGVAALLVQAAGGPGSIDPTLVKLALEATTPQRDIDPLRAEAIGASSSGFVAVSALGAGITDNGPNYFTVFFLGPPGQSVQSVTIDGAKAGLVFDATAKNPPPTVGSTSGIDPKNVSFSGGHDSPLFTINFTPGKFVPGASVSFTVDQDGALTDPYGYQADCLGAGATFTATFGPKPDKAVGAFQNMISTGFNQADGFGLVDALAAVQILPQLQPSQAPTRLGGVPGRPLVPVASH